MKYKNLKSKLSVILFMITVALAFWLGSFAIASGMPYLLGLFFSVPLFVYCIIVYEKWSVPWFIYVSAFFFVMNLCSIVFLEIIDYEAYFGISNCASCMQKTSDLFNTIYYCSLIFPFVIPFVNYIHKMEY